MKLNIFKFIFIFLSVLVVFAAAGSYWVHKTYIQPGPLKENRLVHISEGSSVVQIAKHLESQNVIVDDRFFVGLVRIVGADRYLKAGEFMFTQGASVKEVIQTLKEGKAYQRQFTVPEGLTSWQIVELLNGVEGLSGKIESIPEEGTLLPETYNYLFGESRIDKIQQMQLSMQNVLDDLWPGRDKDLPEMSRAEVIILASIVEKETAVGEERKRIAGVFLNRLTKGMKLQTDPTVIYAITKGKIEDNGLGPLGRRLLRKDLDVDSPYNTYKYAGLPPGPIANPGKDSIAAVLNPEKHEYLYFVADGTGGHAFAKTLSEHNKNVQKWRKVRRAQN
jgi:UPF0755 protein